MFEKRITIFSGHYGSGKTNVAVNFAVAMKKVYDRVSVYDLDIVNPYFRTVDAEKRLTESGVELIVSPFAETNVDIPAMNATSYKMIHDKDSRAVVDLGGDDRGALALGRFRDGIKEENDYYMAFVFNPYRPETRDAFGALEIMEEIKLSSGIDFNAIVSNPNLGDETTEETIVLGSKIAEELSEKTGLPIIFTAVDEKFLHSAEIKKIKTEILPVSRIKYGDWL